MRKFTRFTLTLTLSLFLFSCMKEVGFDDPVAPTPGPGTGNNANSYHPLTTGSWWKYRDSASGNEFTNEVKNATRTMGGRTYTAVVMVPGGTQNDTTWMASAASDYYFYVNAVSPGTGATATMLFHYLNDSLPVGSNWTYAAGQGNGFTANIKTTIVARGLTMTVLGKTYTNVIQTKQELSYLIFGQTMDAGSYDYYVSKGVGLIKVRGVVSQMGQVLTVQTRELVNHQIQ